MRRRLIVVLEFSALLLAGCSASLPPTQPPEPASASASAIPAVARGAVPLPADCVRPEIMLDTTSIPAIHISRSDAERLSGGMGDGRPALTAVLGRVTMSNPRSDFKGQPIDARPAWVVSWTGLMHNLPSGGPFNIDTAQAHRDVYYSTASVVVLDAMTGDVLIGIACGIVRV